jgi:SPP1 gp7 family putative phage head morphogenesis protein
MTDATAVSDLQRETDAFRQRLITMDRQASAVLSQSFSQVLDGLEPRLQSLERQIAERLAAGETVSADWLFKQDRYRTLIRETNQLMTQYGAVTQTVTTAAQQAAVRASLVEAGRELMAVSGGSDIAQLAAGWAAIPEQSVINMVGALQQSTPLGQLFAGFGPDAVKDVNRALVQGLALGLNPRETANNLRSALNITRARAETIVRTETLRAANKSMIAAFEESGVVKGWRWSASLSPRTCVACLSRHGKVYPLSKAMDRHVNCRCSASPYIGDGSDVEWESGSDWIKRQPAALQDTVLGREGGSLFRSGNLLLEDFERVTTSPQWGSSVSDGGLQWAKRQAAGRITATPGFSFTPATSAREARTIARELGVRLEGVTATNLDMANIVNQALGQLNSQGIRIDYRILLKDDTSKAIAQFVPKLPSPRIEVFTRGDFGRDPDGVARLLKETNMLASGDAAGLIRHEIGHAIHWTSKPYNLLNIKLTEAEQVIATEVSKYASTYRKEFVAEVFSGVTGGQRYSDDVMRLYREWDGPKI